MATPLLVRSQISSSVGKIVASYKLAVTYVTTYMSLRYPCSLWNSSTIYFLVSWSILYKFLAQMSKHWSDDKILSSLHWPGCPQVLNIAWTFFQLINESASIQVLLQLWWSGDITASRRAVYSHYIENNAVVKKIHKPLGTEAFCPTVPLWCDIGVCTLGCYLCTKALTQLFWKLH